MWIEAQDGKPINLAHAFSLTVQRAGDNNGYKLVAWSTGIDRDGEQVRELVARFKTEGEAQQALGRIRALMLASGVLTPWSLLQAQK